LLEVNALIVDPPAVFKRRLDDRFGGPLRRWATWQCEHVARIVTPLAATVPPQIDRAKIVELPWGANIDRFQPVTDVDAIARARENLGIPVDRPVVIFAGSFRAWHGVHDFVSAAVSLLDQGARYTFVLVGDGPERAAAMEAAARYPEHIRFVGSVPHDAMPQYLALADAGIAPFNTASHPALQAAGFFWSPLKIYEYMAMGLPTVTPSIPPLDTTIREGIEGALYPEGDIGALAVAIRRVLETPDRAAMGRRARERVEQAFSWQRHCRELSRILHEIRG
jgi:glycosyltransferase involved in cell wall biosynthesis